MVHPERELLARFQGAFTHEEGILTTDIADSVRCQPCIKFCIWLLDSQTMK